MSARTIGAAERYQRFEPTAVVLGVVSSVSVDMMNTFRA
jgi:hypothetical protein